MAERKEIGIMQAPGAEWLVIVNDRQLWEGQIQSIRASCAREQADSPRRV